MNDQGQADISDCPASGAGVHLWIYKAAHECKNQGVPQHEAVRIITQMMTRPPGPPDEVVSSVDKVYSGVPSAKNPRWARVNEELRALVRKMGGGLAALEAASPGQTAGLEAFDLVAQLFRLSDLVCCGWEKNRFDTRPLDDWRKEGLDKMRYLVPSPMTKRFGITQTGRVSTHTLDNTGPRKYLVVEFDAGTVDDHASYALQLAKFAPLVLAVFSGGKSLHSWFHVAEWDDARQEKFFDYAVALGADPKLWTRSQFSRMPLGTHASGVRQTVHYANTKGLV